jgi:hypothetical protein
MVLEPFVVPRPLFQFLNSMWIRQASLDGGSARSMANTYTQTQNKPTQISMPRMGFELTISVLKEAKAVHTLERPVTAIGISN